MPGKMLENVRKTKPRVHCMANAVTANDCANLLLAVGGYPIMADDPMESSEITACCDALTFSLGMISERRMEAMRLSAMQAKKMGIPVVLDPVGVSASTARRKFAGELISSGGISIIRGNAPEIGVLAGETCCASGVDAPDDQEMDRARSIAVQLAQNTGAVVVLTGETDVVTDGRRTCLVHNGHPILKAITGAGCQMTALLGAFAAANREVCFEAAIAAVGMMGLCGEIAQRRMGPLDGNASCRNELIDAAYRMTEEAFKEGLRIDME